MLQKLQVRRKLVMEVWALIISMIHLQDTTTAAVQATTMILTLDIIAQHQLEHGKFSRSQCTHIEQDLLLSFSYSNCFLLNETSHWLHVLCFILFNTLVHYELQQYELQRAHNLMNGRDLSSMVSERFETDHNNSFDETQYNNRFP